MKVIVRIDEPNFNNPDSGLVMPLIIETERGPELIDNPEMMFPYPGKLWVYGGYNNLIQKFGENSLFRVTVEDNIQPDDPDNEKHCRKVTNGRSAESLSYQYLDVIEHPFTLEDRQLTDLKFKPTQYVFLMDDDEGFLYGPFIPEIERTAFGGYSIKIKSFPTAPLIKNAIQWAVPRFNLNDVPSKYIIKLEDEVLGKRTLLTSYNELLENVKYDLVDYIDDTSLLNWFYDLLPKDSKDRLTKEQLKRLKELILNIEVTPNHNFEERKERLVRLLKNPIEAGYLELRTELVQNFISSSDGQTFLQKYVEENADVLLENKLQEVNIKVQKQRQDMMTKVEEELRKQNYKLEGKREELVKIEEELTKTKQELEKKQLEVSTKRLEQIKNKIDKKESELKTIEEKVNKLIKIGELDEQIKGLTETRKNLEWLKQQLTSEIETLNTRYKTDLISFKQLSDTYFNFLLKEDEEKIESVDLNIKCREDLPTASEYIDEIYLYFLNQGREISRENLVNFLVSINQSYLTVFAGVPGIGKTSTVRLLSQALGLTNRFNEISVARGWTSKRDLIGFYNSLNQRFEPSSTGMFNVIKSISNESENYLNLPPYWVLLDEANLSSIEHYWSDFLTISDVRHSKLQLGQNEYALTDSLRFLATINYDNSTEILSRRLLDRAHVILLDPPSNFEEFSLNKYQEQSPILPLPYNKVKELFNTDEFELSANEKRILGEITGILRDDQKGGLPIVISPRSLTAIQQYCSVFRKLLPQDQPLQALDFAVSQKILPQIQGYDIDKRLKEVREKVKEELPRTTRIHERIIRIGEQEHGYYQFFC